MQIFKIVLLLGLIVMIHGQKICENCYTNDVTFTCDGKNCEAFYINPSILTPQRCQDAMCKMENRDCYNMSNINQTASICIACNYAIPHCN